MKRLLLTVLAICSLGVGISNAQDREIRGITDKLAESLAQSGKKTVAVVDFTDLQGNVTELGRFLAEEISASLSESAKGIQVVDRTNLKVFIQENKLAATGIIDPVTARKLGQIAGVDSLITGTLTPFGDSVHLSIKVLDTVTARIVGAARGDIPKTKAIEELLGQGVAVAGDGPHPQPAPKLNLPSTKVRGIRIATDSCRAQGERLVCTFVVTSEEQDRVMTVEASPFSGECCYTKAFDDAGEEYDADAVVLAGKSGPWREISTRLVSEVPTRLQAKFDRFSASSTTVTLLVFGVRSMDDDFDIELRNIPILRQ